MTRLESFFGRLSLWLMRHPWYCLLLVFAVTAYLVEQVQSLKFDASVESLLQESNPERQAYNQFKQTYGLSEYFIVVIDGEDIFSADFFHKLEDLDNDIEAQVPYVSAVESLVNTRSIHGQGDNLAITPLVENIDEADFAAVKHKALNTPYYLHRLIDEQGKITALIIELKPYIRPTPDAAFATIMIEDVELSLRALQQVVARHQAAFHGHLILGGTPAAVAELTVATKHDILVFSLFAMSIIAAILWVMFKRLSAIVAPLLVLVFAITITMSLMMIGHFPMQVTSSILPSFLLAVCIGDAIHLMQVFYKNLDAGIEKKHALVHAVRHTMVAMFFTTLTTSVGLLSFSTSSIAPIASFGLFGALGVWIALILTYMCLPAIFLVLPIHPKTEQGDVSIKYETITEIYLAFLTRHAKSIVFICCLIFVVSGWLAGKLEPHHDSLRWFDDANPMRVAVETIDAKLTGTMPVELLIDTGTPNGIYNHKLLKTVDTWLHQLQQAPLAGIEIRSVSSILDILTELHQALTDTDQRIADSDELLAQEFLLLNVDAAEQMAKYTDTKQQVLRISLSTPWQDAVNYTDFLQAIKQSFAEQVGAQATLKVTGMVAILNRTITEMMTSMLESYLLAALLVSMVMILILRSLKMGLLIMLPNMVPITVVLAIMYLADLPLDMFTLLIGSIAIGLIVDDSVHFIYGFQHHYQLTGKVKESIKATFLGAGRALMMTTIVLCSGFLVYSLSYLHNMQNFGLLTALCILFALLGDFILAPALILLSYTDKNNTDSAPND